MFDIEQLAKARSLSVKISYLLAEIDALPKEASRSGRDLLHRRFVQLNDELADLLPPAAVEDRELMNIILHPPKGLWLTLNRSGLMLDTIVGWVKAMDESANNTIKTTAELKLLFFFGSEEALKVFLALYRNYQRQLNTLEKLLS